MLILGLLGMYFDAVLVFVTSQTLFLRLALAILCQQGSFFAKQQQTTHTTYSKIQKDGKAKYIPNYDFK
jgi:hypothetical protein